MLFCRAKQRRGRSEKTYADLHRQFADLIQDDAWLTEVTARYIERTGDSVRPHVLKERIALFASRMEDKKELRNNFVEDLIHTTEIMKNVALQKSWQRWRAPRGVEFVTSDNPLVTFIDLGNGRLNSGHGLRKQDTIGIFPIAPHVCLAMGPQGPESVTIESARVQESWSATNRFVYFLSHARHIVAFAGNCFEGCTGSAWALAYGDNFGDLYTPSGSAQRDAVNLLEEQLFPNVPKLESCRSIAEKESQLVQ